MNNKWDVSGGMMIICAILVCLVGLLFNYLFLIAGACLLIAGNISILVGVNKEQLDEMRQQTKTLKEMNFRVKDLRDYAELNNDEDPS